MKKISAKKLVKALHNKIQEQEIRLDEAADVILRLMDLAVYQPDECLERLKNLYQHLNGGMEGIKNEPRLH